MATLGSKLITKEMQWQANMTELNHLGKALMIKPTQLMGKMDTLFSAQNYYSDNPLLSVLMGNKKTEQEIDGLIWEWELKGANSRPLVVLEDVDAANTTKGMFKTNFRIKLDENWFLPGDVICPGTSNKKYQARIVDAPLRDGDGWIYTLRMNTDNPQDFMPPAYFTAGTQWAKLFSTYEEAAEQGGSTQFSLPIALQNRMNKLRKQYKITDFASTAVLAVAIPDSKGGYHKSWIRYAEVEFWKQWYRELERNAWYSRSTETVIGANGRPVVAGAGIQEQLEDSHQHYYTHLTAKLIEEYLMDIFYSRIKPGSGQRKVKGYTGEYGMIQFHKAIQNAIGGSGFIQNVNTNINSDLLMGKTQSPYTSNGLVYGYQFLKYRMANGIELELVHNPLYDDREINFEIDPVTGYPLESQRITFLDFSGEGGESNIQLKKKAKSETFTYIEGNYGPYGPNASGKSVAHAGDYYEMHIGKTQGVHIQDITKCGELILSRN
jgi:hypothetical protein